MVTKTLKINDKMIDFTLKDQYGENVSLSTLKGKKIFLSFHPLAWTSICAEQMKDIENNFNKFEKLNVIPFGISVDSVPCKLAWAKSLGLTKLKILSDFWPHGDISKLYGIFRDKDGFSERANFIINEEGNIVFIKIYPIKELPDLNEIFKILEK